MTRARLALLSAAWALALAAPAGAQQFDHSAEARNYSKIEERHRHVYSSPAYQQELRVRSVENRLRQAQILASDGPPNGRDNTGNLCQSHEDGCAGDIRYYDWAKKGYGITIPVLFTARNGSTLSGNVWMTRAGPARRPGVVITNGSVQAPEELYWFQATALAKAGYVVLTWDPQGQGYSDTYGQGPDRMDGVPSQQGRPFFDGTEDALDFFFSTPDRPYAPRPSCTSGTSHAARHADRVSRGLNARHNPLWEHLDPSRIGLVGHSLGGAAISYVGQLDPRVSAMVGWDNLQNPTTSHTCPSGSSQRPPSVPIAKPALGLSADYFLTPTPYTSAPDPQGKSGASLNYSKADVDTGALIVRGGTHFEFSFIPNPGFGATLRGVDMVAWYTTAWLDRYVKGDPTADDRLATDRWRRDDREAAVDPGGDGNMFSFHFRSRLDFGRAGPERVQCDDVRRGCPALRRDGLPEPYDVLESVSTPDAASGPTTRPTTAGEGPICRDSTAPVSRVRRRQARIGRRGLVLRGTALDRGCERRRGALVRVTVALARLDGRRCRFLRPGGTFGPRRSCRRAVYLRARGRARWRFTVRRSLRPGVYRAWIRGVDAAGNVERPRPSGRNMVRLRLRR